MNKKFLCLGLLLIAGLSMQAARSDDESSSSEDDTHGQSSLPKNENFNTCILQKGQLEGKTNSKKGNTRRLKGGIFPWLIAGGTVVGGQVAGSAAKWVINRHGGKLFNHPEQALHSVGLQRLAGTTTIAIVGDKAVKKIAAKFKAKALIKDNPWTYRILLGTGSYFTHLGVEKVIIPNTIRAVCWGYSKIRGS